MHREYLSNNGRNFGQVFTVVKFGGCKEIGHCNDELQNARELNGRLKSEIHGRALITWRKGTITRRTKGGGKRAKIGPVTTMRAKACPCQPWAKLSRAPM